MEWVHIYFDSSIEVDGEIAEEEVTIGRGEKSKKYLFKGVEIFKKKGEWYTFYFNITDEIPKHILEHVTNASFRGYLPLQTPREIGVYKDPKQFGDAICEIDVGVDFYPLKIRATKPSDIKKLYDAIRAGTLRPYESWAKPQGGMSRKELEEKVRQMESENESLKTTCETLQGDRVDALAILSKLAEITEENKLFYVGPILRNKLVGIIRIWA